MKINKVKSSDYDTVKSDCIARYIKDYAYVIYTKLDNISDDTLAEKDRTELKQMVAELETVKKRVEYITDGWY
jgi:hypothetical protein